MVMRPIGDILAEQNPGAFIKLDDRSSRRTRVAGDNQPTKPATPTKPAKTPHRPAPEMAVLSGEVKFNQNVMALLIAVEVSDQLIDLIRQRADKENFWLVTQHKLCVIGYPTGKIIKQAMKCLNKEQITGLTREIQKLAVQTDFHFSIVVTAPNNRPRFWKLCRDYPDEVKNANGRLRMRKNRRWAVTMLVDVPELGTFYNGVEGLLNRARQDAGVDEPVELPRPVAHIALATKGASDDGIGLASLEDFERAKQAEWHIK